MMRLLLPFLAASSIASAADFTLTVKGIRNDKGKVRALIYTSEKGFPDQPEHATARAETKARKGSLDLTFKNLPPGTYAIAVLHDEDSNGKLSTNFIGIPKEGVGVPGGIGNRKPTFATSRLTIHANSRSTITLKYW